MGGGSVGSSTRSAMSGRSGRPWERGRRMRESRVDATTSRRVPITLGFVFGAFFIIRASVELVTIDYSDPSSYATDWGGPRLVGVPVVHCGLGLLSPVAIGVYIWRRLHPSGERSAGLTSTSSS